LQEDRVCAPHNNQRQDLDHLVRQLEALGPHRHAFNAAAAQPFRIQRTGPTAFASRIIAPETWLTGEVDPATSRLAASSRFGRRA
jgi:predicted component of type VI protein secretion system